MKDLSRRSFLTGSALLGAGAALSLAGCQSPSAAPSASLADTQSPASSELVGSRLTAVSDDMVAGTEDADIVVVGSGTAGTFAAVRAAENGARVIWLEKTTLKGGTSTVTEGTAAPNTKLQLEAAGPSDEQQIFNLIQTWHQWGARSEAIWSHFENGRKALDWAVEHGAGLTFIGTPESPGSMCFDEQGQWISLGEGVLKPLWAYGDTFDNLDFRLETPAVNIAMDNGVVTGVYAKNPDGTITRINAKAIILATGGFGLNEDMLNDRLNVPAERITFLGFEGQDGDGINMALTAGAVMHAPSAVMYGLTHVEDSGWDDIMNIALLWPPNPGLGASAPKPLPVVNQNAERFFDESTLGMPTATSFNIACSSYPRTYVICDEERVKAYDGMDEFNYGSGISEGNLRDHLEKSASVVKADTIEELARLIDVDEKTLAETIAQFNAVANGDATDARLASNPSNLTAVTTPPFYAAKMKACAYSTCAGIATNYDCQALDRDGAPIEGVYVCGNDNGSLYYNDYPYGVYSGSGQGGAASTGFAAAEAACAKA